MDKKAISKVITVIIIGLLCVTSTLFIENSITKAKSINEQLNLHIEQKYLSSESDTFEYKAGLNYNFGMITQEGIASDDNGTFFIATARWPNIGKITVAKRDAATNSFIKSDINGISELNIGWHIGDPFCDDKYLIVPKSDWNFYNPVSDKVECHVFYLNNLTELPCSPYRPTKYGDPIPGASSGAYYNGYYYFSTYNEGKKEDSKIYKFSFNPNIGFSYEETHGLGTKEVQGIEIWDNKCYFIRSHGSDPNVYCINMSTWDTDNLEKQNLKVLSNENNGPYEGITFDINEEGEIIAYFGYGLDLKSNSFFSIIINYIISGKTNCKFLSYRFLRK
jgi:hypothetical protein